MLEKSTKKEKNKILDKKRIIDYTVRVIYVVFSARVGKIDKKIKKTLDKKRIIDNIYVFLAYVLVESTKKEK